MISLFKVSSVISVIKTHLIFQLNVCFGLNINLLVFEFWIDRCAFLFFYFILYLKKRDKGSNCVLSLFMKWFKFFPLALIQRKLHLSYFSLSLSLLECRFQFGGIDTFFTTHKSNVVLVAMHLNECGVAEYLFPTGTGTLWNWQCHQNFA